MCRSSDGEMDSARRRSVPDVGIGIEGSALVSVVVAADEELAGWCLVCSGCAAIVVIVVPVVFGSFLLNGGGGVGEEEV